MHLDILHLYILHAVAQVQPLWRRTPRRQSLCRFQSIHAGSLSLGRKAAAGAAGWQVGGLEGGRRVHGGGHVKSSQIESSGGGLAECLRCPLFTRAAQTSGSAAASSAAASATSTAAASAAAAPATASELEVWATDTRHATRNTLTMHTFTIHMSHPLTLSTPFTLSH